ncbi:MAG: TIGR01244 family sulfur transferase [Emcibacteraceae bacterium]
MEIRKISPNLSVSEQIKLTDINILKAEGYKSIINTRPDQEEDGQVTSDQIKSMAGELGLDYVHIPVIPGQVTEENVAEFKDNLNKMTGPVLSFCRTGTRAVTLWALSEAGHLSTEAILKTAGEAGYNLESIAGRLEAANDVGESGKKVETYDGSRVYDVVIIGGGAGGLAVAGSIHKRDSSLDMAIIEPNDTHYYQPGWTLVGGGVFSRNQTKRPMSSVMPKYVNWIKSAVASFQPENNCVKTEGGESIRYKALVVSPGLKLDWDAVKGLRETLGKNGVTSNYRFDLASYTWELVKSLKRGKALFTQPPMPIKCAGAPQKAMYLSCDYWKRHGRLNDIDVNFHTAGGVLFGVADYVPALEKYIEAYGAKTHYFENLIAIDGDEKKATFSVKDADGNVKEEVRSFDMIHVCPPQTAHDFMKNSPITNADGWVEVNNETLQHVLYGNIFGIGDGISAPNAKTAAAVRKQAPVVAHNIVSLFKNEKSVAIYEGYGSCPLTVEKGKVVLAEFGYGGALQPTMPTWLIDGTKATGLAWFLKEKLMPTLYFDLMFHGHEWLAKPKILTHSPILHDFDNACDFQDDKKSA